MVTINNEISTSELKSRIDIIKKEDVGFSDKDNLYICMDGEYYLVLHNGQKIPQSSEFTLEEKEVLFKAITDEDVFNRLLKLVKK